MHITWFNDLTLGRDAGTRRQDDTHLCNFLVSAFGGCGREIHCKNRALETMREVSAVPIFGMGDYQMGRGIVGGPLMQTKALGLQGADAALRILKGEKPTAGSPRRLCCSVHQPMTAGNWSAGASMRPACRRAASCIFVSRPFGISTVQPVHRRGDDYPATIDPDQLRSVSRAATPGSGGRSCASAPGISASYARGGSWRTVRFDRA